MLWTNKQTDKYTDSNVLPMTNKIGMDNNNNNNNNNNNVSLVSAGIPATKEPVGLLKSDGKRPDGLILVPWQSGKPLTWDVTVAHTLAASYVSSTACEAGAVAEMAATLKSSKYADLSYSHHFQRIAFKTLGSMNSSAVSFFRDLGHRISQVSGDSREAYYLFQHIAVTTQRFNSVLLRDSFVAHESQDDSDA